MFRDRWFIITTIMLEVNYITSLRLWPNSQGFMIRNCVVVYLKYDNWSLIYDDQTSIIYIGNWDSKWLESIFFITMRLYFTEWDSWTSSLDIIFHFQERSNSIAKYVTCIRYIFLNFCCNLYHSCARLFIQTTSNPWWKYW